jgi:hypothetical protein
MLGIKKVEHTWGWAACGKHPVARDFFSVGQHFPLVKLFAEWVEKGYPIVLSRKNIDRDPLSWRFWARGDQRRVLACGLIRDSSDSCGRFYPLLIMGNGELAQWQEKWDLIPRVCERTWIQMEYISARVFGTVAGFEYEIRHIKPPAPEWSAVTAKREEFSKIDMSSVLDAAGRIHNALHEEECFIMLDHTAFPDQNALITRWHSFMKSQGKGIPNATFMGGTTKKTFLAFFRRPLTPDDFLRLWTLSVPEV